MPAFAQLTPSGSSPNDFLSLKFNHDEFIAKLPRKAFRKKLPRTDSIFQDALVLSSTSTTTPTAADQVLKLSQSAPNLIEFLMNEQPDDLQIAPERQDAAWLQHEKSLEPFANGSLRQIHYHIALYIIHFIDVYVDIEPRDGDSLPSWSKVFGRFVRSGVRSPMCLLFQDNFSIKIETFQQIIEQASKGNAFCKLFLRQVRRLCLEPFSTEMAASLTACMTSSVLPSLNSINVLFQAPSFSAADGTLTYPLQSSKFLLERVRGIDFYSLQDDQKPSLEQILSIYPNLTYINCVRMRELTNEGLDMDELPEGVVESHLELFQNLVNLEFVHARLSRFPLVTSLRALNLHSSKIASLEGIGQLKQLSSLYLPSDTNVPGLEELCDCTGLRELAVRIFKDTASRLFPVLRTLASRPSLEEIDVSISELSAVTFATEVLVDSKIRTLRFAPAHARLCADDALHVVIALLHQAFARNLVISYQLQDAVVDFARQRGLEIQCV